MDRIRESAIGVVVLCFVLLGAPSHAQAQGTAARVDALQVQLDQALATIAQLKGELKGKRDTLLQLLARAGITLTEDEAARVQACDDPALLDRWVGNVLGAKTAGDVLS